MPKLKTKKAAAARFKVTSTGKLIRRGKGIRHLLEHVSSAGKRRRHKQRPVDKSDAPRIKGMLPYA